MHANDLSTRGGGAADNVGARKQLAGVDAGVIRQMNANSTKGVREKFKLFSVSLCFFSSRPFKHGGKVCWLSQ